MQAASFRLEAVRFELVEAAPEPLAPRRAPRPRARRWSTRTSRRSITDPFARDHHVADVPGREPEDPVPREARRVERRRGVVVEDDEVGGRARLERPEQRLAERARRRARALSASGASGQSAPAPRSSSRSRKNAARDSSNMSEPIPSVPSATRPPSTSTRARPTELFMFERALCATVAFARATTRRLVVVEVHAVREQRALVERARAVEPLGDADAAARDRVALVDAVLGGVDVQPDAELGGGSGAGGERLVGERERRVRADEPARERRPLVAHAREEAPVLRDARRARAPARRGRSSRSRARERSAERLQRVGDHVERAVDRVRRRVVVDDGRRAGEQRLHRRRRAPTRAPTPRRARGRAATRCAAGSAGSSSAARARTACRARAPSRGACARRRSRGRRRSRSSRGARRRSPRPSRRGRRRRRARSPRRRPAPGRAT